MLGTVSAIARNRSSLSRSEASAALRLVMSRENTLTPSAEG